MLGSISNGVSIIKNILESDDVKGTIAVCRKLGIKITKIKSNVYKIYGTGVGSFYSKKNTKLFNPTFFLKRSINIKNITNTKANSLFVSPNNIAAPI